MNTFRIGFDERPGHSGPARYVGSIVRCMDPHEFEPLFFDGDIEARLSRDVSSCSEAKGSSHGTLWKGFIPSSVRTWTGFAKNAMERAQALRKHSCDVFHTQWTGCEEAPVAAWWSGLQTRIGTFHVDPTYDLDNVRGGIAHRVLEWSSNRCLHRAIAVSEAAKRSWIRRTGIPEHRVVTIHNGIDPEYFRRRQSQASARAALGLPADGLILGGVGRLDPAKGFAFLIEALALLRAEFPQALVAIAGSGPLQQDLQAKAAALGIAERVVLLGFQEDVNLVLDACDIFVMCSLCETLGYALLEAMSHELPAVGSDVGGIPEVIVPGETGILARPRDAVSLAKAIRPLLLSAEVRERFGSAGRERVVRHFRERDMVNRTLDVYREMLSSKRTIPRLASGSSPL